MTHLRQYLLLAPAEKQPRAAILESWLTEMSRSVKRVHFRFLPSWDQQMCKEQSLSTRKKLYTAGHSRVSEEEGEEEVYKPLGAGGRVRRVSWSLSLGV